MLIISRILTNTKFSPKWHGKGQLHYKSLSSKVKVFQIFNIQIYSQEAIIDKESQFSKKIYKQYIHF